MKGGDGHSGGADERETVRTVSLEIEAATGYFRRTTACMCTDTHKCTYSPPCTRLGCVRINTSICSG